MSDEHKTRAVRVDPTTLSPKAQERLQQLQELHAAEVRKLLGQDYKEDKSPEPSLARKALNFTKAKVVHIVSGSRKATDEQVAARYAICAACPSRKFHEFTPKELARRNIPTSIQGITGLGLCKSLSCGCFIHSQPIEPNKLRWAEQVCPHSHWKAIPKENEDGTKD